jgi:hypothetical protein
VCAQTAKDEKIFALAEGCPGGKLASAQATQRELYELYANEFENKDGMHRVSPLSPNVWSTKPTNSRCQSAAAFCRFLAIDLDRDGGD